MTDDTDGVLTSSGTAADSAAARPWRWLATGRGRLTLAGGLVVIVLMVVGVVQVMSSRDTDTSLRAEVSASATPPPLTSFPAPKATAPDGGELKIVDKGFSQRFQSVELTLTPGYGPNNPEPYTPAYSAVIIENTSRNYLAIGASALVKYLDKAGKAIPEGPDQTDETLIGTDVIYPGERKGIADLLNVDNAPVADLTTRPGTAVWVTKDELDRMRVLSYSGCFAPRITTSGVRMIHTSSPKVIIVAFRIYSSCSKIMHANVITVYRDASGKIIGSSDENVYGSTYFGPGESEGSALVRKWFPPGMDEAQTEVYLMSTV